MALSLQEKLHRGGRLPSSEAVLLGRARLLARLDADLIEAVVVRGQPTRVVARLMGLKARAVRDRVNRLVRRMASRSFIDAARAMPCLPPADAELAKLRFCEGHTQRGLCQRLGLTSHELRRRLDRVTAQIETISRMRSRGT